MWASLLEWHSNTAGAGPNSPCANKAASNRLLPQGMARSAACTALLHPILGAEDVGQCRHFLDELACGVLRLGYRGGIVISIGTILTIRNTEIHGSSEFVLLKSSSELIKPWAKRKVSRNGYFYINMTNMHIKYMYDLHIYTKYTQYAKCAKCANVQNMLTNRPNSIKCGFWTAFEQPCRQQRDRIRQTEQLLWKYLPCGNRAAKQSIAECLRL